jgi:hypothetical protein
MNGPPVPPRATDRGPVVVLVGILAAVGALAGVGALVRGRSPIRPRPIPLAIAAPSMCAQLSAGNPNAGPMSRAQQAPALLSEHAVRFEELRWTGARADLVGPAFDTLQFTGLPDCADPTIKQAFAARNSLATLCTGYGVEALACVAPRAGAAATYRMADLCQCADRWTCTCRF